jgi:hypothetical protein
MQSEERSASILKEAVPETVRCSFSVWIRNDIKATGALTLPRRIRKKKMRRQIQSAFGRELGQSGTVYLTHYWKANWNTTCNKSRSTNNHHQNLRMTYPNHIKIGGSRSNQKTPEQVSLGQLASLHTGISNTPSGALSSCGRSQMEGHQETELGDTGTEINKNIQNLDFGRRNHIERESLGTLGPKSTKHQKNLSRTTTRTIGIRLISQRNTGRSNWRRTRIGSNTEDNPQMNKPLRGSSKNGSCSNGGTPGEG